MQQKLLPDDKIHFLLTDRNGIASYFHALLCMTHQTKKAEYFRDTCRVWNPSDKLERSILSTSAAFYSEEQRALTKFIDLPLEQFKPLSIKIFRDWYSYKLRKQSKVYKRTIQYKLKDFTNSLTYSTIDNMEDLMTNKSIYQLISDFCEYHATERERFIFRTMTGLDDIVYDEDYRYVLNYPGRVVTRQTFHAHKRKLIHKFKGLTLKASAPTPIAFDAA